MKTAKKILATLLPAGMVLIVSTGIAAADSYSNSTWDWNASQSHMSQGMDMNMSDWWNGDNSDATFGAETFGHNEVPPVPDQTQGDIMVTKDSDDSLSYIYALHDGKNITAAHLHCAPPGENGPAVVTLYSSSGEDVNGTLASGDISDSDILASAKGCADTIGYEINDVRDLTHALENGDIYANAHSLDYPDGVSRGQLSQDDSNGDMWSDMRMWDSDDWNSDGSSSSNSY